MSTSVKIEIFFKNHDVLMFKILPESAGDKIKKVLGRLKEIKIGQSDFDDMFLIRGNDENKIKNLFRNPDISNFMLHHRRLSLELTPYSLVFSTYLPIRNIEHLKMIYNWLSEILNELCIMDSGYESPA
jgi:hypothetical protein